LEDLWSDDRVEGLVDGVGPVEVEECRGETRGGPIWVDQNVGEAHRKESHNVQGNVNPFVNKHEVNELAEGVEQVEIAEVRESCSREGTKNFVVDCAVHKSSQLEHKYG